MFMRAEVARAGSKESYLRLGRILNLASPYNAVVEVFRDIFRTESLMLALDILIKLGIGAILGGMIGWEREIHGRPAGVRTHMLMVIGVITFSEVSKHFGGPDESRIAAQIVTGVGFLGAGTILRMGPHVMGLTTAASIWASAAIGMAVSSGGALLLVAVGATLISLITLGFMDKLEAFIRPRASRREMSVSVRNHSAIESVLRRIREAGGQVRNLELSTSENDLQLLIQVGGNKRMELIEELISLEDVTSASWSD